MENDQLRSEMTRYPPRTCWYCYMDCFGHSTCGGKRPVSDATSLLQMERKLPAQVELLGIQLLWGAFLLTIDLESFLVLNLRFLLASEAFC